MKATHPATDGFNKNLFRFSLLTTVVAVFLIVAGATVTSTGSGDAVPDWPLSYGSLNPPMIGGVFYEHGHRLIAGLTGILIGILAIWLLRIEPRRFVRILGMVALGAVIIQATLGGLRVLVVSTESVQDTAAAVFATDQLEPVRIGIAITHAFLAQTILCMLFAITLFTSRSWMGFKAENSESNTYETIYKLGAMLTGIAFVQLLAGALVRHTGSGLIIPDFPLMFGQIFPPFGDLPNNPNAPFPISDQAMTIKVILQLTHRLIAFAILGFVIYLFARFRDISVVGQIVKLLTALVFVQVVLGGLQIWTEKAILVTVSHVVVGSVILASCVVFTLWSRRLNSGNIMADVPTVNKAVELG